MIIRIAKHATCARSAGSGCCRRLKERADSLFGAPTWRETVNRRHGTEIETCRKLFRSVATADRGDSERHKSGPARTFATLFP